MRRERREAGESVTKETRKDNRSQMATRRWSKEGKREETRNIDEETRGREERNRSGISPIRMFVVPLC